MEKLEILPDESGFSLDQPDGIVYQALRGGPGRYRRDMIGMGAAVGLSWTVDPDGYDYLMQFFEYLELHDFEPFTLELPFETGELEERTLQLIPGTVALSSYDGLKYTVRAQFEMSPPLGPGDEFFENVAFLLPMSENFNDVKGKIATVYGSISIEADVLSPSGFSGLFADNGRAEFAPDEAFNLYDDNFTFEGFATVTSTDFAVALGQYASGAVPDAENTAWGFSVNGTNFLGFAYDGGTSYPAYMSGAISMNVRVHWAWVRNGGICRGYWAGVGGAINESVGGVSFTASPLPMTVGSRLDGANGFRGRQDNIRLTKGVVRYWGDTFIPPTGPFPTY